MINFSGEQNLLGISDIFKLKDDYSPMGMPVNVIKNGYKIQKKYSKFRVLNYLYKKIFGFRIEYFIPDEKIFKVDNQLFMNPNTFEKFKEALK